MILFVTQEPVVWSVNSYLKNGTLDQYTHVSYHFGKCFSIMSPH